MTEHNEIERNVWELETTALSPYYRSYLGNGFLGVQMAQDGTGSIAEPPVRSFIAGVYDGETEWLVEIPRWSGIKFRSGENELNPDRIADFHQVLNMKEACFSTRYTWKNEGKATDFEITFFVSRADAHLAAIRFAFIPHYDGEVTLENTLDGNPFDNLTLRDRGSEGHQIYLEVATNAPKTSVAQAIQIVCPDGLAGPEQETDSTGQKAITQRLRFRVEKDRRYTFYKYVGFFTSYDCQNPLGEAGTKVVEAEHKGFDLLFREHAQAWAELWESDILVDDPKLQRRIHSSLYHLLSSVREGQEHSIPPMGLSNDGWGGHIFWDSECFMLPSLMLLYPELAKTMVMYRARTLDVAKANAKALGYEGAAFGWQTGRTGKDCSRGGHSEEIHIVGDVAWGQWQTYLAIQDRSFLENTAAEIIIETARFWASRVTYNEQADRYEILGVIPPDESTLEVLGMPTVDNSVFTNAIAQWNLRAAVRVSEMLGRDYPAVWKEIADKMYFPFDAERNIFLEYDGYNGHPIKQPDVGEMIHPLEFPMSEEVAASNFDYYLTKADTELGHSYFPTINPIVACRLKRRRQAWDFFEEWDDFFLPPFEVMREVLLNDQGIVFLTAIGGFLQNFLYGFGGIRLREDGLKVEPFLPDELSRITFKRIYFGGKAYRLTVERKNGQDTVELKER